MADPESPVQDALEMLHQKLGEALKLRRAEWNFGQEQPIVADLADSLAAIARAAVKHSLF